MLILALECSATPASVALWKDGQMLGESYVRIKQTHSQTLLPMTQALLNAVGVKVADLDRIAVSHGPGSFTGVRIGIATAKGLAFAGDIPCCGVSTLEVIAAGGLALEGRVLCAVMDARVRQVYGALFRVKEGKLLRLTEDEALPMEEMKARCAALGEQVVLLGDGAQLCKEAFAAHWAILAPEAIRWQRASCVAMLAEEKGTSCSGEELSPVYLRVPQAERELKRKREEKA